MISPTSRSLLHLRLNQATILVTILVPFVSTLAAGVYWGLGWVAGRNFVLFGSFTMAVGIGVTVGYHRMLTHNSFKANPLVKGILLILGACAFEGTPISWSATHLAHHAHADKEGDPHSPMKSLFHAHMGWLFMAEKIDPAVYAKRQMADPIVQFVTKTTVVWVVLSLLLPFLLGGWSCLIWAGLVRIFFVHHITWSVNSLGHSFGTQDFNKGRDLSRNNWVTGLLALGEGWHNNHHAFPRSAFHTLKWYQIDISGQFIQLLGILGLAHDIHRVPGHMIDSKRMTTRILDV